MAYAQAVRCRWLPSDAFDSSVALERAGTPIGADGLFIAAHALAAELVLVTGNVREFQRVPMLEVVDWIGTQPRSRKDMFRSL